MCFCANVINMSSGVVRSGWHGGFGACTLALTFSFSICRCVSAPKKTEARFAFNVTSYDAGKFQVMLITGSDRQSRPFAAVVYQQKSDTKIALDEMMVKFLERLVI